MIASDFRGFWITLTLFKMLAKLTSSMAVGGDTPSSSEWTVRVEVPATGGKFGLVLSFSV